MQEMELDRHKEQNGVRRLPRALRKSIAMLSAAAVAAVAAPQIEPPATAWARPSQHINPTERPPGADPDHIQTEGLTWQKDLEVFTIGVIIGLLTFQLTNRR